MVAATPAPPTSLTRNRRIRADMSLLLVSVIWGSAFVAQRIAAVELGVYLFNGLRFLLGALVLLPFVWLGRGRRSMTGLADRKSRLGAGLAGVILVLGAGFQQAGLRYTTAGNAGFITGMYVIFIPLFLALVWKKPPRPSVWIAACMALAGLFLLSVGYSGDGQFSLNRGDVLVLICAIFWSMHVLLIDWLVRRADVLLIAISQYLVCSLLNLSIGMVVERDVFPAVAEFWWVIAYTGIISVGLGYTLQAFGQRYAPPADAAVILSLEAVFAALAGWFFLDELLSPVQLLGCGIMLAGMLLSQAHLFRRPASASGG